MSKNVLCIFFKWYFKPY